uniref:Uncharacterized protein n=1 Tax=Tanacetum cinerariifolium TaxID=118510 RepID=A0A699ICW9_TANCI|nr:hypothetical protein [Tanacetum cinerariifolium]
MIRNYMPSGPDVEIDYSKFTYGPKQTSVDESDVKTSEYTSCESDSSIETTTSMPAPVENAPKVICEPKVCTDAPIIEEYESDSDDDSVSNVQENKENPTFAFIYYVKHVKPSRENVKETGTTNHCYKVEKHDRNGHTRKGLNYAFTRKLTMLHNKELASPKKTTLGKDISNLFMAGSLPKTKWTCIDMDPFEFSLVYLVITRVISEE